MFGVEAHIRIGMFHLDERSLGSGRRPVQQAFKVRSREFLKKGVMPAPAHICITGSSPPNQSSWDHLISSVVGSYLAVTERAFAPPCKRRNVSAYDRRRPARAEVCRGKSANGSPSPARRLNCDWPSGWETFANRLARIIGELRVAKRRITSLITGELTIRPGED